MHSVLNKLATFWLALALIVAPLQAAASLPAPDDKAGCPMHAERADDPVAQHHGHQHGGDQAAASCPQCQGHGCDHGKCGGLDCCSLHMQISMTVPLFAFDGQPVTALYPRLDEKTESLPPSRLYRPPV